MAVKLKTDEESVKVPERVAPKTSKRNDIQPRMLAPGYYSLRQYDMS